ncbi:MAG: hypothetical protein LIO49_07350 [Ruminococcus sp.]|nr:hypothetical protein [Ruminococcus sp.]
MSIWGYFGIFFVVSLLCCAIGFKKYVYFLSVGYGFSVIGLAWRISSPHLRAASHGIS